MTMHVIIAVGGYFIFSSAVGAMAQPTKEQERGFYGWSYRFCQTLAANAQRLADARFPSLATTSQNTTLAASTTVERHLEVSTGAASTAGRG